MAEGRTAAAERKNALRSRLIDIAGARIAEEGVSALRARDLAREADCAVGAIYNVFDDLNALVMAVNAQTFRALGAQVTKAVTAAGDVGPQEKLVIMGHAYLDFASAHTHLWRALFDLEMSTDMQVPDWYLAELASVFGLIAGPLAQLHPDQTADERDLMVRTLFSSVHGIVLLGLERRISAVPLTRIKEMISVLLRQITA